jgi:hypothetical protein
MAKVESTIYALLNPGSLHNSLLSEGVLALVCDSTSYRNALTSRGHACSYMQGPITSETNVMKQAGSR